MRYEKAKAKFQRQKSSETAVSLRSICWTQAQTASERAESWGNAGKVAPSDPYWACMGIATRLKSAVKSDPSFRDGMMDAYKSTDDLMKEKRHVTCALFS